MRKNSSIYEINTRVWLKKFSTASEKPTLKDVPKEYWKRLSDLGMDYIWLMGIWQTNESIIKGYCFEAGLVKEYKKALKDFSEKDVIGSPYSIDEYEVNPIVGTEDELLELKKLLNSMGIKLILDFVPNHFSTHSSLIETHPELFLPGSEEFLKSDPETYFRSKFDNEKIFAHGRDPFLSAWKDTVQINYFNLEARAYMVDVLKRLTYLCDGVRCDMAMLLLNNVFDNVWSKTLTNENFGKPTKEFWEECIHEIKSLSADFIFIGEAYWNLEWELQQLGFDYTYDKKLLDRLRVGHISEIKGHLTAGKEYQQKSVRFIENHDEERAALSLGAEKSKAAAVVMSTITGMRLYYDGQLEGKIIKLPIQLGREPKEKINDCICDFYNTLLSITNGEIFRYGSWELMESKPVCDRNKTYNNFLIWKLTYKKRKRIIAVNYSGEVSKCRIKLDLTNYPNKFKLKDILNNKTFYRETEEVNNENLYIELGPFKSHIFSY